MNNVNILLILFLLTISIFCFNFNYLQFEKFSNQSDDLIPLDFLEKKLLKVKLQPTNNKTIPKTLFQTSHISRDKIPNLLYNYSKNYKYEFFNNQECEDYIKEYFNEIVLNTYKKLKLGAHKTDLWRYCKLYVDGGVYLDIKTKCKKDFEKIFVNYKKPTWYAVYSDHGFKHMYNGIIASPPRNPIFLRLINYIVSNDNPSYHDYCIDMLNNISKMYNTQLPKKNIENLQWKLVLMFEKCDNNSECKKGNQKKLDRYELCCNIYKNDEIVFNGRDPDYPWT